jgi:hypothetical protein
VKRDFERHYLCKEHQYNSTFPLQHSRPATHIKAFLLLLLCCITTLSAAGQQIDINIKTVKEGGVPVAAATIRIEETKGSARPAILKTDKAGVVHTALYTGVTYLVEITSPGLAVLTTQLSADSAHTSFTYTLHASQSLQGATVTASKSLMRQDGDMTIIDPEPLAAASTSGYEVLEKTPGIIADQDGNFFMTSTTPATIYINGREMKMSNSDIATMLKSLPPNSIERIEIMRTPSAKFDASGGGGIINVVLKKGVKIGLTGSVNAGAQQGVYGNQNVGVNLSYSDGSKSGYLNMNFAKRKSLEHISSRRKLNTDSLLQQTAETIYDAKNVYLGYGGSKTFGTKWDLSYDGRLSGNFNNNNTGNRSLISQASSSELSDNISSTTNDGHNWNVDQSIDTRYKIDTSGSEWTAEMSWNGTFGKNRQDLTSSFIQPSQVDIISGGDVITQRHNYTLQTDAKLKYKYRLTFEGGIKSTNTSFHHSSDFTATYNGTVYPDPYRSITYKYSEHIHAAYVQFSKQLLKDIIIKPGLRLEHTDMDGQQTRPGNTEFSIRRTDLFPYLYISKKVMTIAGYELRAYLVYRKTIQRPAYDYMNPYQRFIDQYLYETGNPALRPQFTHNYEANVSIDERPLIAVGFNDVQDIFANVIYQREDNPSLAYRTWDNLGKNREFYLRGFGAIPPGGVYFFVLGGQYNRNMYDGYYNNTPLEYSRETWTIFTYHNLKLGKRSQLTVNGFARFKSLVQFTEVGTFGMLNASINRTFLDKKLTVTLSAQDIFFSNKYNYSLDQGPISLTGERYNDSRRYAINVRYNFGVKLKEDKKDFPAGEIAE